jgi:two-component system, chemotaxis family, protein-glutamate methylesterase/glutaminase
VQFSPRHVPRHVVAIAASLGGVAALRAVLSGLPQGFPAAVLVVQHQQTGRASGLAGILSGCGPLPVTEAREGDRVEEGRVHLAPPDHHLLALEDGTLTLSDAPAEHFSRPSADALFRSVALHFGARAIAVVLTGRLGDGSGGVGAVHDAGGTVLAQDPASAMAGSMPASSIRTGSVDRVLALDEIAPALVELVMVTA